MPRKCPTLKAEIQHRAFQYRNMRFGRGITHEEAFIAGANYVAQLIKDGEVSIEEIKEEVWKQQNWLTA